MKAWHIPVAAAVVAVVVACGVDTDKADSTTSPAPSGNTVVESTAAVPSPAKSTKAPTVAQKNAVGSAENYLDFAPFSRTGLIKQLKFEGYSTADATYAVDHITVDWTEQADRSAHNYMELTHFSRSGLIKQLKFEGFTTAQAEHGAKSVGL